MITTGVRNFECDDPAVIEANATPQFSCRSLEIGLCM
jgi:hypothetical protein